MASLDSNERDLGTVARAVAIMRHVAESSQNVSVSGLARQLGLPVSTVHRMLHLLVAEGIVEQRDRHSYVAGAEYFRLGSLVVGKTSIARIARPYMQSLVDTCDEYCVLCLYLPAERKIMVAEAVSSSHPLSYIRDKFVPISPVWGATGRAVLAHLPADLIKELHAEAQPSPVTRNALPPLPTFLRELDEIRARGYANTRSQKVEGAVGFAAPLFQSGSVIGSLCLTIPEFRYKVRRGPALAAALVEKARELNAVLGGAPAGRLFEDEARSAPRLRLVPSRFGKKGSR